LREIFISKILTRKLTDEGVGFASLLNSQLAAPVKTQMRFGLKRVLGLRIVGFSILYKYSFVRVERFSTFSLEDTQTSVLVGGNSGGYTNGVSNNLVDALSGNTAHASSNISFQPGSPLRAKQYTQVYGPSQPAYAPQIKTGTQYLCTPTYYSRNKILPNEEYWTRPAISNDAYSNGIRFFDPDSGSLADVYSANGTLQVLSAKIGTQFNSLLCLEAYNHGQCLHGLYFLPHQQYDKPRSTSPRPSGHRLFPGELRLDPVG
jgi:hypothetical protein